MSNKYKVEDFIARSNERTKEREEARLDKLKRKAGTRAEVITFWDEFQEGAAIPLSLQDAVIVRQAWKRHIERGTHSLTFVRRG